MKNDNVERILSVLIDEIDIYEFKKITEKIIKRKELFTKAAQSLKFLKQKDLDNVDLKDRQVSIRFRNIFAIREMYNGLTLSQSKELIEKWKQLQKRDYKKT